MRLVSFDLLRSTDIPTVTYLKPELLFRHRSLVSAADWVLFPPYWLANTLVYALGRRIFPSLSTYHLGHDVVTAYWRIAPEGAFHNNVSKGARVLFEEIPPQAIALVERVAKGLGIDHAGFDVAVVDGHCYLLELNRLFGNDALTTRGISIGPYIFDYLQRSTRPPQEPDSPVSQAV